MLYSTKKFLLRFVEAPALTIKPLRVIDILLYDIGARLTRLAWALAKEETKRISKCTAPQRSQQCFEMVFLICYTYYMHGKRLPRI